MDSVPTVIPPSLRSPATTNDLRFVCTLAPISSRRSGGLTLLIRWFKQSDKEAPDFRACIFEKTALPGLKSAESESQNRYRRGVMVISRSAADAVFQRWVGAEE